MIGRIEAVTYYGGLTGHHKYKIYPMENIRSLKEILNMAKTQARKKTIAVSVAQDHHVLLAAEMAIRHGIARVVAFGNKPDIEKIAKENGVSLSGIDIEHEEEDSIACMKAVKATHDKKADIIMKGNITSAQCLRHILNKEYGLRQSKVLSHIGVFEIPAYHKLLALTDAGMNIAPDFATKVELVNNSVAVMQRLGIAIPKVAVLAAVEVVNPDMPATLDAAALSKMSERGQLGNVLVDGPLAMDNAISKEAAIHKKIRSEVAGDADILLAHNIEVANAIYKANVFFSGGKVGAFITGAASPIVFTSRTDDEETKLYSMAMAAL